MDYSDERIDRELSIMLKPENNPSVLLQLIHNVNYYRDLFSPPRSDTCYPLSYPVNDLDCLSAAYFIHRVSRSFNLWAPFEEALLNLPPKTLRSHNKDNIFDMNDLRENVLRLAYAIAIAMPWRKYPQKPTTNSRARTLAGAVVARLKSRLLNQVVWELIDSFFDKDEETVNALKEALDVDCAEKAKQFKQKYGDYWAAHILCGSIFEWCDRARPTVLESGAEKFWETNCSEWERIAMAVECIRWEMPKIGDIQRKLWSVEMEGSSPS